jgi:dolichol-phosphate mannosyltransferase
MMSWKMSLDESAAALAESPFRESYLSGRRPYRPPSVHEASWTPDAEEVDQLSVKGVSIVIPAYNEESRIGLALETYIPALESIDRPFEVIVVTDGTDRTPEVVRSFADRGVSVVVSANKLGKGGALLLGFQRARCRVVGFVDADGSLGPDDLLELIKRTSQSDCVIASRWLPGSRWINREPLLTRFSSRAFNVLVRGILGVPVFDTQCGAKFFKADLLHRVLPGVTVTNMTIDVGLLFHVKRAGVRIEEVPVTWNHDKRSRFRLGVMIATMFITLLGIRVMNLGLSRIIPKWVVTIFSQTIGNA